MSDNKKRTVAFDKGVLPMLGVLLIGFAAMGGALYYDRTKAHEEYIAARPPIPTTYHAFVQGDTVVSDVLDKPDLSNDTRVETSKFALMVPVGYGGDVALPSEPCHVVPDGYYTELGVYDERTDDGVIDGVIAVYLAPPDADVAPGECPSNLVFMVRPEYQLFDE